MTVMLLVGPLAHVMCDTASRAARCADGLKRIPRDLTQNGSAVSQYK